MTQENDVTGAAPMPEGRAETGAVQGRLGVEAGPPPGDLYGWRLALILLCAALALTFVVYGASAASAVDLWWNRSSYNHGFLIIPISLYLVWDKREALAAMTPRPWAPGLLVILMFSLAWTLSRAAGINEGEHFALVGVIEGVVLAVLGRQLFLSMLLPMAYLWLMVPTGTVLYPLLQGVAHWQSVVMLQLSGIPVFTEGFFIEVPTGIYEVAEGCSGLNFILAGLALSPLFGYMMYDSMRKRLVAIGAMLVIAVLANGIRIYAIIAIAEFTERRIDIVDDHLLYGWGFFAVILVIAGLVGSRFADPVQSDRAEQRPNASHIERGRFVRGALVAMAVLSVLPLYRLAALSAQGAPGMRDIDLAGLQFEAMQEASPAWVPVYPYATKTWQFQVSRNAVTADVYIAGYFNPRDASEMVTSGNDLVGGSGLYKRGSFIRRIENSTGPVTWKFTRLASRTGARLVAEVRQVDGTFVSSALEAKLLQARATLFWSRRHSGVMLVSVPVRQSFESAEQDLTRFVEGIDLTDLFNSRRVDPDPAGAEEG